MSNTTKTSPDPVNQPAIILGDSLRHGAVFGKVALMSCFTLLGCATLDDQPEPADEIKVSQPKTTVVQAEGMTLERLSPNGLTLNGIELNGIELNGIELNGIELNGIELNGIQLNGIELNGVGLNGIELNGIELNGIELNGIELNGIELNGIELNGIELNGIELNGIELNGIELNALRLNGIELNGIELNGIELNGIGLNKVRLNGISLEGLKLNTAKFNGAPLTTTQMSDLKLALSYVTKCALTTSQCVTVTDVNGVSTYQLCGQHGLDPTWNSNLPASVANEQAVTECVMNLADNDVANPSNVVSHINQEAPLVKDFFDHAVYCALPAGTCVTATDVDGVSTYQVCGSQGLDPAWLSGPPTAGPVAGAVSSCVTAQATTHGDAWADYRERFKTVLKYATQCALRADQSVTVTDWNGSALTWQGSFGLADWWTTAPLNPAPSPKAAAAGEELVSACLMARTNALGKSVSVSVRARPELTATGTELTNYARHEGAFMGNLFSATPVAQACSGSGGGNWLWDPTTNAAMAAGRQCAEGTTCGFEYVGACTSVCTVKPGVNGETLFDNCSGNSNVVNTFLYSVTTFSVNTTTNLPANTTVTGSDDAPMVATGDFNNDGNLDLAVENNYASLSVRLSDGAGGFATPVVYNLGTGVRARTVIAKDLNADGRLDLVTANQDSLSVLLGNGDGTFATPTKYTVTTAAGTSASVAAADFNADGKLDLVTNLTSGFAVFFGNGNGTFGAQNNRTGGSSHHSVVVGDFNGDG